MTAAARVCRVAVESARWLMSRNAGARWVSAGPHWLQSPGCALIRVNGERGPRATLRALVQPLALTDLSPRAAVGTLKLRSMRGLTMSSRSLPGFYSLAAMLAATLFAATFAARAADAAPSPNDSCLMCHSDAGAKNAAGNSIAVDPKKFAASVHGQMNFKCTDCHSDAIGGEAAARTEAQARQLRGLPRSAGQGISRYGTRQGPRQGKRGRRHLQ